MENIPIYLDYMATTPVDPRVVEAMLQYLGPNQHFGNAASHHYYGRMAAVGVEKARAQVAHLIGATEEEVLFTSGATEANNLAIIGAATFYQRKGRHMVTMASEHASVLDTFKYLEKQGFEVTYLKPNLSGLLAVSELEQALRDDTILVSIMQANNEIGVIQDILSFGKLIRSRGIIFHVDAAQSLGKIPIDLYSLPVDLMSFSAHKIYGPKGIGALFVRHSPRIRLNPITFGGSQEGGVRSGTVATHQVVGLGEACYLVGQNLQEEISRLLHLRQCLWDGIKHLPGIELNGSLESRLPGNLNFRFKGLDHQALWVALHSIAFSSASACSASKDQPSHVLQSIGLNSIEAQSAIRLSFGRFTTLSEIERTIEIFCTEIPKLYQLKEKI